MAVASLFRAIKPPYGVIVSPDEATDSRGLLGEADNLILSKDREQLITGRQRCGLYVSHFWSMWNSRSYEFASVLFTASAYPENLTVASLRGLSANLAALLFSPAVGRWCNRHPSRLRTLQICIVVQRLCIGIACLAWATIVQSKGVDQQNPRDGHVLPSDTLAGSLRAGKTKHVLMAILIFLGMIEKLSAAGNLFVMERDWVPLLATSSTKPALHVLNASMKRIDLLCKLVAPLAISAIALGLGSLRATTAIITLMQILSVGLEIGLATWVWKSCKNLQTPRVIHDIDNTGDQAASGTTSLEFLSSAQTQKMRSRLLHRTSSAILTWLNSLRLYLGSIACLPSVAFAVQSFSVLNLSASMTVYLLAAHYPLSLITGARTLSTGVEITSTFLIPLLITWLSSRSTGDHANLIRPLVRVGLWGLWWQLLILTPAVLALIWLPSTSSDPVNSFPVLTGVLFVSLAVSRLGPFAYSLVEQQLVQTMVPADQRVEFSGVEFSIISFAEVMRWSMTGIFGRPEQFKGVTLASFAVIALSTGLFWLWKRRWWLDLDHLYADRRSDTFSAIERTEEPE